MKWGRKKPFLSSSSSAPLISHVLPVSWLSKFKKMSIDSESKPVMDKRNGKREFVPSSLSLSSLPAEPESGGGGGRFYGGDGDAFWRLSFGEDCAEGKPAVKSVLYESDDELDFPAFSGCHSCGSKPKRVAAEADADLRQFPTLPEIPEINVSGREQAGLIKTPRIPKSRTSRRRTRRTAQEKRSNSNINNAEAESMVAKKNSASTDDDDDDELRKYRYIYSMNTQDIKYTATTMEEDCAFPETRYAHETYNLELKNSKKTKLQELKSKSHQNQQRRKSFYLSREMQLRRTKPRGKVRVFSPRTVSKVETCKTKAQEDMKKTRFKMDAEKEIEVKGLAELESLAVVKCSFDPQKDFRDSMIDMILEKNINQPEELEELLACYLTLNSDEYHDLIIKVFRQVWFDLNQACFEAELGTDYYFDD